MDVPLIRLEHVNTWFPCRKPLIGRPEAWIKAVNDVSIDILRGESLGLVGESGCGKSTLGRTILRLAPLHSGAVRFSGADIGRMGPDGLKPYRPLMQMVFQDPRASLNPKMTVFDIIREALVLNRKIKKKDRLEHAVRLLGLVDLRPEHIYRYPHEFSGGQQQRISIARALATDPQFIVFDEATSALDVSVQAQIINLMTSLQKKLDLTYLFISHDLSIMEHVCKRVAVMYAGRIIEVQDSRSLFTRPRHPYTRALENAIPVADPESVRPLGILRGEVPKLSAPPPGCHFHPRCRFAEAVCTREAPPVSRFSQNSWVRCHFHDTLWKQQIMMNDKESI